MSAKATSNDCRQFLLYEDKTRVLKTDNSMSHEILCLLLPYILRTTSLMHLISLYKSFTSSRHEGEIGHINLLITRGGIQATPCGR